MRIIFKLFFIAIIMVSIGAKADTISGFNTATSEVITGLPQSISQSQINAAKQLTPSQQEAIKQQIKSSGGITPSIIKKAQTEIKVNKNKSIGNKTLSPKMLRVNSTEQKKNANIRSVYQQNLHVRTGTLIAGENLKPFGYKLFQRRFLKPLPAQPVSSNYVIGPGDVIKVLLWGLVNAQYTMKVGQDGTILFPRIGPLSVAGMKYGRMKNFLTSQAKRIAGTNVAIMLGRLRQIQVFVLGAVRNPGPVNLTAMSTMLDALMAAGGPNGRGSVRNIELKRKGVLIRKLDLYNLLMKGDKNNDLILRSGDIVFVPLAGPLVGITGDVKRPAIYELKGKRRLKSVIALAGGLLPSSYKNKITLQRFIKHTVRKIFEGSINNKTFMSRYIKDGDLISIKHVIPFPYNSVLVTGYTPYDGLYQYKNKMKLSYVLKLDMFSKNSNMKFGLISRQFPPGSDPKYITFVPGDILSGKEDVLLNPTDKITLYKFGKPQSIDFNIVKNAFLVSGTIKYPGVYAFRQGMKLSDVVNKKQMLIDTNIHFGVIKRQIKAGTPPTYITFIPNDIIQHKSDIQIDPGDSITFYPQNFKSIDFNTIKDAFLVSGTIKYPGVYAFRQGMKLSDVVKPNMMLINTNRNYAEIDRRNPKTLATSNIIKFAPSNIVDHRSDIALHKLDVIHFYPKYVYAPIKVSGAVKKSLYIPYHSGIRLSEALSPVTFTKDIKKLKVIIFRQVSRSKSRANLQKASGVKLVSKSQNQLIKQNIASIFLYDLFIQKNKAYNILLNPGDVLVVRKVSPNEMVEKVSIAGYMKRPMIYKINGTTSLYDVLSAAGGFRKNAYPNGVIILRKSVARMQKKEVAIAILQMKQTIAKEEAGVMQADLTSDELRAKQAAFKAKRVLLGEMEKAQVTGRISGISLPKDLNKLKNSPFNILLENGDKIYIPHKPSSVLVFGEVYNPSSLLYIKGMTVRDYLDTSGGLTKDADKANIFVIKANGAVVSSSNLHHGSSWNGRNLPEWGKPDIYSTNILDMKLKRGDAIIVPVKIHVPTMWRPLIRDVMQIIYQGAITIYTITKL